MSSTIDRVGLLLGRFLLALIFLISGVGNVAIIGGLLVAAFSSRSASSSQSRS